MTDSTHRASFRDPSGFMFYREGSLYRQINHCYKEHYQHLHDSGLYDSLVNEKLFIEYKEDQLKTRESSAFMVVKPALIPFISYPYEWCFSQLKDAALLTLQIQKNALEYDMSLKDASAFNIQFLNSKPILIDTLSLEQYKEGEPWVAYKQFCQHFLAPLLLMSSTHIQLNQLLRTNIDGIPLDMASSMLPKSTWLNISILMNIHWHAKSLRHYAAGTIVNRKKVFSRVSFKGLIDNLESCVKKLKWIPRNTEWTDYYGHTNYSSRGVSSKKSIISQYLDQSAPKVVWDLGANVGQFSRIASERGIDTICFDADPGAVEKNYLACKEANEAHILPILLDLTNPSPDLGWATEERDSFFKRPCADVVMALALIHHLRITHNIPLSRIAQFLSQICCWLIVEFIPKEDEQTQRLLANREDSFGDYNQQYFENTFGKAFDLKDKKNVDESNRVLYLFKKKDSSL